MTDAPTLENRKATASEHLAALQRNLGTEILDGGNLDPVHAAIERARREIDEIDAAGAEVARRQRQAAADQEAARRSALRTRLLEMESKRLSAVGEAEAAARSLAASLRAALDAGAEMRRDMQALDARLPDSFEQSTAEFRLTAWLAVVLATASKGMKKFGALELRFPLFGTATDSWIDSERREGAKALEYIIGKPKES